MVGSAVQNGMRLIVVVNGLDDPDDRASEGEENAEWDFEISERDVVRTTAAGRDAKVFGGESRSSSSQPERSR